MSEKRKDAKGRILYNGETQDSEGRYRFRYQDAAGKRKTVYSWRLNETDPQPKGKRTCEALRTLEKQISRDLDNGINSQPTSKITVNQAFENAMNANQKKRPSTRTLQRGIYENHIREQLGSLPLIKISRDMMKDFYLRLYTEENLAPGTIMTVYIVLNPLFEEQVKNGNLRVNNSSLALSDVKKLVDWETAPRHALTAKEQEAFVNFYSTTPSYSKWVPLLDVLLGTGMRIGEALSLTWNDIDWESNFISVNHTLSSARIDGKKTFYISVPKTAAGNRKIPMLGKVRAALMSEYEQQEVNGGCMFELDGYKGFVFFNRSLQKIYDPSTVNHAITRITESYNKAETETVDKENRPPLLLSHLSPHILRHSFASRAVESNAIPPKHLQTMLGHSSIQVTMDIYAEISDEALQNSMSAFDGI